MPRGDFLQKHRLCWEQREEGGWGWECKMQSIWDYVKIHVYTCLEVCAHVFLVVCESVYAFTFLYPLFACTCVCAHAPVGLLMCMEGARINSFYSDLVSAYVVRSYPHLGYSASGVPSPPCPLSDSHHSSPWAKGKWSWEKKSEKSKRNTPQPPTPWKRLLFAQKAIGWAIYLMSWGPAGEDHRVPWYVGSPNPQLISVGSQDLLLGLTGINHLAMN